jgi:hypothetical protein
MAVAVVFQFPKGGIEIYDKHLAAYGHELLEQPARISHVCFETAAGYTVVDVWESLEAYEAFDDVLTELGPSRRDPEHPLYRANVTVHRVHHHV